MKPRKRLKQPLKHLRHSLLMVGRNRLVYAKLSVTVVLSFSLLLGFLFFTDARLYNDYKEVFAQPREIVLNEVYCKPASYHALLSQIEDNLPEAEYYGFTTINGISQYENGSVHAQCSFLPPGDKPVYRWNPINYQEHGVVSVAPIELVGEKQDFDLKDNEVIINESWYNALIEGGAQTPLRVPVHFDWQDGGSSDWELNVVGICADTPQEQMTINNDGSTFGYGQMYVSAGLLSRADVGGYSDSARYSVWVNTTSPEQVIADARSLDFVPYGVSKAQEEANAILKVEKTSKAYIAAVILVLLGINLYSSFSNALQERRYEIGVKRALGAGEGHIVRQFLYESMFVLLFDTLLSAVLVVNAMIGYKTYQAFVLGEEWVVYISRYSVIMFLVCSLSLTVVFSLIFALQSTQVEIISTLQDE